MKIKYYIIALLSSVTSLYGQISGGLDLAPKSQASAKPHSYALKEIAVTSFGATPEGAEKRAISDAVRQAVGAYVDAKTITENDALIKDRILSVSSGFVKEYKVTSSAKKTDDGLYEISIVAMVEANQVAAALKEANVITGEVAGKNLWAEASTKLNNAEDARKMLEDKVPELVRSLVNIEFLDKAGKPFSGSEGQTPASVAPAFNSTDPQTGQIELVWLASLMVDQAAYKKIALPLFKSCFEAIAGVPPQEFTAVIVRDYMGNYFQIPDQRDSKQVIIIESVSKDGNSIRGVKFEKSRFNISINGFDGSWTKEIKLRLTLLDANGDIVSAIDETLQNCVILDEKRGRDRMLKPPFPLERNSDSILLHGGGRGGASIASPIISTRMVSTVRGYSILNFMANCCIPIKITLAPELVAQITSARCELVVPSVEVLLKSAGEN